MRPRSYLVLIFALTTASLGAVLIRGSRWGYPAVDSALLFLLIALQIGRPRLVIVFVASVVPAVLACSYILDGGGCLEFTLLLLFGVAGCLLSRQGSRDCHC